MVIRIAGGSDREGRQDSPPHHRSRREKAGGPREWKWSCQTTPHQLEPSYGRKCGRRLIATILSRRICPPTSPLKFRLSVRPVGGRRKNLPRRPEWLPREFP